MGVTHLDLLIKKRKEQIQLISRNTTFLPHKHGSRTTTLAGDYYTRPILSSTICFVNEWVVFSQLIIVHLCIIILCAF